MPPHNSLHTVSVTLYGPALFQSTALFCSVLKDHAFVLKNESGTEKWVMDMR